MERDMTSAALIWTDWKAPLEVLSAFADEPYALGLFSGGGIDDRWSYVMRDPAETAQVFAGDPPFDFAAFAGEASEALAEGPPFQGGVAGLAAYEAAARFEPVELPRSAGWPDIACARYDALLAFDHGARRVCAVGRGADKERAHARAREALSWLGMTGRHSRPGPLTKKITPEKASAYEAAVTEVRQRIAAGEIFQANIARSWKGRLVDGAQPFDLAARLHAASPAPFAAYLRLEDRAVVSNSPERFVSLDRRGRVETRPIKGTAPRSADPGKDAEFAQALSDSSKDRAENLMIVDLMRNDIARVCEPGSVVVPDLFRLTSFTNVHHLVSTVAGLLAPGRGAGDLIGATFPPGSITGAPKVQAIKIIAGLETPRGPYCGMMFWLGADGAFDSSVLIRTVAFTKKRGAWSFDARAGAGIVADSAPAAERIETEDKISAIRAALLDAGA